MVKILIKNRSLARLIFKLPFIKRFFILKVTEYDKFDNEGIIEFNYKSIRVTDGPTKKTGSGRFGDIDKKTLGLLIKYEYNVIHDIAVSSGITSLDLYSLLLDNKFKFDFNISDKFSKIYLEGRSIVRAFDADGKLMFGYFFCFLADKRIPYFFISALLFHLIKLIPAGHYKRKSVTLYDTGIKTLIKNGKINDLDYDVFKTEIRDKFTFVRCMNILNLVYFPEDSIIEALKNIFISMKENAIFLIGRTDEKNVNKAGFYRKNKNKLLLIEDINGGTELKRIIASNF